MIVLGLEELSLVASHRGSDFVDLHVAPQRARDHALEDIDDLEDREIGAPWRRSGGDPLVGRNASGSWRRTRSP